MIQCDDILLAHLAWVTWSTNIGDSLFCKGRDVGLCDSQLAEVLRNTYQLRQLLDSVVYILI